MIRRGPVLHSLAVIAVAVVALSCVIAGQRPDGPADLSSPPAASEQDLPSSPTSVSVASPTTLKSPAPPLATAADGCGPSVAPDWGPRFGEPGVVFGWHSPVIADGGDSATAEEASEFFDPFLQPRWIPEGLELQSAVVRTDGRTRTVASYYGSKPIPTTHTLEDFLAQRAVMVLQRDAGGGTADTWMETFANSPTSTIVRVASFDAALTLAMPLSTGVRTSDVYWSDGTRDWIVTGNIGLDEALDIAKSLYCP